MEKGMSENIKMANPYVCCVKNTRKLFD